MKLKFIPLLATIVLLLASSFAQAGITCTPPISTGFSIGYSPTSVGSTVIQGTVTFNCTRSAPSDANSLFLRASDGLNVCSGSNGATLAGNCISYEAYQNSTCNTLWTKNSNNNSFAIPVTLSNVTTAQPITISFWGCIGPGQNVPAGVYTDTVAISIHPSSGNVSAISSGSFPVSIITPAACSITSIADVAFGTYVAFRATPLVAPNSNIVLNCTPNLPYSLALDATSGVVAGLNYSLALSTSSSSGTGPGQTHTISGTMPANQAGACASGTGTCAGSDPRTLTITY